jgi:hypothetical protein
MSIYICRWPNGDLSLVCGKTRLAIEDVLDEVGNPDGAELIPVKHAVAVHFRLKKKIENALTVPDCLELEGIDERLFSEVCDAYPILDKVLEKEDATPEEIAAAVEREKDRVGNELPELSDDPNVAMVQLQANMPRRLAEHYNKTAKANAKK